MRKMKIGVHEGQMKQLFAPYHAELNASEVDDVGEKPLRTLLDSVTMRCVFQDQELRLHRTSGCMYMFLRVSVCACVCVYCVLFLNVYRVRFGVFGVSAACGRI